MNKNKIEATVVADSTNPQNDRLTSVLVTMPRIILSEINTHRMLSKNTSSSRAIPFNKMVEAVHNNPFIPIAWQKEHTGMQGSKYITEDVFINEAKSNWLVARDNAVESASYLNKTCQLTKQLCNRLLEPFMWTTMLITGSKEGWDNFFSLRCGDYSGFKSRKEASKDFLEKGNINTSTWSDMDWRKLNKGQAEIHMMDLAEKIYDAMNKSTPVQLKEGEWHIPMVDKIPFVGNLTKNIDENNTYWKDYDEQNKVKISVSLAARTSYTIVGDEKEVDYEKMIELHDRLLSQDPPHSSPLEHCARAMSDYEYDTFVKGKITDRRGVYDFQNPYDYSREESIKNRKNVGGWCNNLKGFIPYRYMIDNKINLNGK